MIAAIVRRRPLPPVLVLLITFLSAFPAGLTAQDLKVTALVDQATIGSEERVTFTIEVQGTSLPDIRSPQPPQTTGLVLANQFPSSSRNISVVNGAMTVSMGYSWQFVPTVIGIATIGAATVTAGGKNYKTDPIRIKVIKQSDRPVRQQRKPRSLFDDALGSAAAAPSPKIANSDLFIRAKPSKRNAFQNEQITIEYDLYFRSGVQLRQSRLADSWDAEGFWREELEVESRPVPKTVVENGVRYNVITLKRVAVFPTRTGELNVDALKIESEATAGRGARDPFFSLRSRYQPVELSSRPVRIIGKAFPDNPPASFSGAVGSYRINAAMDRPTIEVGESVKLSVAISGSGNIATLEGPDVDTPGIFEVYDPRIETSVSRKGASVRGTKTFNYVLVPRSNGIFTIPPVEFSFLNPRSGRYETIRSAEFTVDVTGEAPASDISVATTTGLPVDDIPPISLTSASWSSVNSDPIHRSSWIYVLLLLPLLGLVGIAMYNRFNDKLTSDVSFARNRRANPIARKHLKRAAELLEQGNAKGYYEELDRAVLGFVGDRLNVGERALTRSMLDETLDNAGILSDTRSGVVKLLDECDQVRFAPIPPNAGAMQTAMDRASDLIESIHDRLQALAKEASA